MAYQEWGSGPPHFDGKNYQMWSKRMGAFLRGKGQTLWDVTVDTGYVQPVDAKSALNANHTASRTKLASHAQRANDVPVNFS
jgi:hypothetical protein